VSRKEIELGSAPNAPWGETILSVAMVLIFGFVHAAGLRLNSSGLSAGGYVGMFMATIVACNICHKRGFLAGRKTQQEVGQVSSEGAPSDKLST